MKALVVGGTGPTGPFVVEGLLKRGYEVTIFHRGTHEVTFSQEVDHIHASPHFPESIEQALEGKTFDLAVVTYGRLRYLAEALKKRTDRLVSVGGGGVYRATWATNTETAPVPLTEDSPLQTNPDFHKLSYQMAVSENVVMAGHQDGCYRATHLRYCWIYGPRAVAPMEWYIIRRIIDGRKQIILPCGGLTLQTRAYAENAAHALLLAVDHAEESAGKIYNVSDDRVLSLREWVEIIVEACDVEVELIDMPYSWARPSYPYMRRLPHRVMSNAKIKAEVGYRDVVPTEEALRRTVDWLMVNQPERDGEMEKALGDPFDYTAEDHIIRAYKRVEPKILAVPFAAFVRRHAYPRPKKLIE
ncbi:NAD-dependent epimerase/dehydratase family protein [Chloroflexota bacterium]